MNHQSIKRASIVILVLLILLTSQLQGCRFKIVSQEEKREDVPFVIVSEECVPKELADLIEQKKENDIKLTYADEQDRYIIIGYGRQKTGGYSIYIKDVSKTQNAIYVDTCLLGPKKTENIKEVPSYPVIVLKISEMGLPVVFE